MNISIFDTSVSDSNLGNQIIMDAVLTELYDIFENDYIFKIPCMEITNHTLNIINSCKYSFFGGTNALNGNLEDYTQMGINKQNYKFINNFVSLGMGWWQYQNKTSKFTKKILTSLFRKDVIHSVRDEYTKNKLNEIGINNVINTGCPTIWRLKETGYPNNKSSNVLFTLTDYNQNSKRDSKLINLLLQNYRNVYCFIQGADDFNYLKSLEIDKTITCIPPNLKKYDEFLENNDVDYIGNRLHAGIRALQHGKKSIIIGIDNRALEMKKDYNIPVILPEEMCKIDSVLMNDINIHIPHDNINKWKNQFLLKEL